MTQKLYYLDSHQSEFTAVVTACEEREGGYIVTLDSTCFFPEGGGQLGDSGFIGEARVGDTQEKTGEIYHYTDRPVTPGEELPCRIDYEKRLRRMQNHSGEHIVSGLVFKKHGYNNVGFHMGEDCMTIDFSGELTWDELMEIEKTANEVVRSNVRIITSFPSPYELKNLEYRSKLELTENVRLVTVEGVDVCACCAPHVSRTGEVGFIKILDMMRHRGGVRISLVCGMDALDTMNLYQTNLSHISSSLSAKRDNADVIFDRFSEETRELKLRISALGLRCAQLTAAQYPETDGNICVFDNELDDISRRELANLLADKCGGIAAVFSGTDGDYKYIICSRHADLRKLSRDINTAVSGRGGGRGEMIQGSAAGNASDIKKFFNC